MVVIGGKGCSGGEEVKKSRDGKGVLWCIGVDGRQGWRDGSSGGGWGGKVVLEIEGNFSSG